MDSLLDVIQADAPAEDEAVFALALDGDYQANMYTIEEASRETGAIMPTTEYTRSPYDAALMKLINSVPMR